jgi:HD superfamily phosphohydrolase
LISARSPSPLGGLISGALDLDKIEYLTRDARMCGVPYGTVDVDRLLHSLTLVEPADRRTGGPALTVGIHEKGVSALEALLFAKYLMYRNVYWHHAVRSATSMFKRVVRRGIAAGRLEAGWIARATDEALMEALRDEPLVSRLRRRRLFKRVLDLPAGELPAGAGDWIAERPDLVERVEDALAAQLTIPAGSVLLDFPAKPEMLASDIPVRTRGGAVAPARLGLQHIATDLHTAARRLRVFTAEPHDLAPRAVIALAERSADQVVEALEEERALL